MLIDDLTVTIRAGDGGDGIAAFNKNKMTLGPSGGSGGDGGSVWAQGVSDLGALNRLRFSKVFKAENGRQGRHQLNDGTAGEDLVIHVPIGTVIHNLTTGKDAEISAVNQRVMLAKGGHGGRGNYHFRGPENTSPRQFERGTAGQEFQVRLELKLIADVGLVGLPNAGKSSLLNELTKAKSKVANYPFTTLEPNLGAYYDLILADIPGLIEGASAGKGLGIKFLRHIERTRTLFHLVSAESDDPARDYAAIRRELGAYDKRLLEKTEYLFLSKSDTVSPDNAAQKLARLKKLNPTASTLSIHDWDSLERVKRVLNNVDQEKQHPV